MPPGLARLSLASLLCVLLASSFAIRVEPLLQNERTAASPAWSQSRGDSSGRGAVLCAPVMSAPVEAWRTKFTSIDSDPVVFGGALFVVGTQHQGRRLYAHDVATGAWMATSSTLDSTGRAYLAASQGHVAVVERNGISIFAHRGAQLTIKGKKIPGSWPSAPCAYDGYLFVNDSTWKLSMIDMRTAKVVSSATGGIGRPAFIFHGAKREPVVGTLAIGAGLDRYLSLITHNVRDWGGKTMRLELIDQDYYGPFAKKEPDPAELAKAFLARLETSPDDKKGTWFAYSVEPFASKSIGPQNSVVLPNFIAPIATEPAIFGNFALGFSSDGALIRFGADGGHRSVLTEDALIPNGARRGRATIAGGVMYLENWAVEIESGRVLWCDPKLEPASPLFPAADGLAIYVTSDQSLVAIRDPRADATSGAKPNASNSTSRAGSSMPGNGDGLVLRDGRRVAGKIEKLEDGSSRVVPSSGAAETFAASTIALIETGGAVELVGEQYPVFQSFWDVLRAKFLDGLEQRFEDYRKNGFTDDSRRLLAEARAFAVDSARAAAMERRLGAGMVNTNSNAAGQRAFYLKEETKLRESSVASVVKASDWCREQGLVLTASALLSQAAHMLPGNAALKEKAALLVPRGFSEVGTDAGPLDWLTLAAAILPVGGSLLPPDHAVWARAKDRPWNTGALALQSQNLLLFSRERDSNVMGSCLRRGEKTVRVLDALLLPVSGGQGQRAATKPLEVRLHHDRAAYLAEFTPEAKAAMEWTAGFYSPIENVSRFYVPRNEETKDPLARDLDHVLVHEITHHYISDRWLGTEAQAASGDVERAGYWVVEGFARFIEDQVVEMENRGEGMDDETVESIDAAARIASFDRLIPMGDFLDLSKARFHALSNEPVATIQLRSTIVTMQVTWKNVFYEQGGSLVFYLMNRAGPEKRALLLEYLRAWYDGRLEKETWKSLGYASASDLEKDYTKFLNEPGH